MASLNDAEIVQLQEFCGLDRQQAVVLLNKYKTLENAANAFFTDPVGALKDEPQNDWVQADNLPAFQIEAQDTIDIPSMSRPPSRIDNRANVEAAVGQQFVHQQYSQDNDLQRAIAMSKEEMPPQESGVTLTDQRFGPATRTHYDPSQWAVTPVASSREVIEHPPPSKRRRIEGQPAFLRGSSSTGYLASLLNIYYHIPLARQAFLFPSLRVHSYGFDPTWWSGMSDENTKSLSVEASSTNSVQGHIFLAELQCLMAFLGGTDRAYGSVDALSDLTALKSFISETPFSRFIESWITAGLQQDPSEQLTQIFTSEARKASQEPGMDYDCKNFHVLDAPVEDSLSPTLVDLMDNIIWHDSIDNVDEVWMEQCAQIFTMRLHRPPHEGNSLGLEIPPEWYPERYMSGYKDAAREMRIEVLELKRQFQKCEAMQRRCSTAKSADKRIIKIRDVLQAAAQVSEDIDHSGSSSGESSFERSSQISEQLQAVIARLDKKVEALEHQKKLLQSEMIRVSRNLAKPGEQDDGIRRMKYVLQGVATKPNITYIRVRSKESQQLIHLSEGSSETKEWQWWRFEWFGYSPIGSRMPGPQTQAEAMALDGGTESYTIQELSEEEVLHAAQHEHDSAVLVYADQQAISYTDPKISVSLKEFVKHDNFAFRNELDEEAGVVTRTSSQKTSTTIMDENSSENEEMEQQLRHMTPMSTNSLPHDSEESSPYSFSDHSDGRSTSQYANVQPPAYADKTNGRTADPAVSKIGAIADQMLEKCISDGPVQIEHPQEPLR